MAEDTDGPYSHLRGMFSGWNLPNLDNDVSWCLSDVLIDGGEEAMDNEYDEISELVWRLCGM